MMLDDPGLSSIKADFHLDQIDLSTKDSYYTNYIVWFGLERFIQVVGFKQILMHKSAQMYVGLTSSH